MSTTSAAFAAILDDLVRVVDSGGDGPAATEVSAVAVPVVREGAAGVGDAGAGAAVAGGAGPEAVGAGAEAGAAGAKAAGAGAEAASSKAAGARGADADAEAGMAGAGAATPAAAVGVEVGPPPGRLRGRGDLTLVVGLGHETSEAAAVLAMSAGAGAEVQPISDRRGALAARADGVRREIPIVGVFSLPGPDAVAAAASDLVAIAPDQVWAVVDASRKHDDTAAWVRALDQVLAVDAVAATGAAATRTPETVHGLGLPVLWLDAPPG